jgi:hypothetical protein
VTLPNGALVPDGTAAAPGLRFAADTGTGLARSAAGTLAIVTEGVQRAAVSSTALQIDIPVTGSATQANSHNATAGRLGRVFATGGLFGWGVAQGASLGAVETSANGVTVAGLYRTDTTMANLPASASSGLLEVFHGAGGDTIHQRWTASTADSATRSWQRRSSGGTWTGWALIINHSTLLGTVSQSAGLPTGAVIERGSAANGEFVRFADGTQICTRTNLSVSNAATASGSLFRSADVAWTFPASFAVAPVVTGNVDDIDGWLVAGVPGLAAVNLRVMSSTTKLTALTLRALAVGRWF